MNAFKNVVTSDEELREIVGTPGARAVGKERTTLDGHCRAFIARSPFLLMATAGADGRCDVSPKGDAPGFVLVLDERRLVIPDRHTRYAHRLRSLRIRVLRRATRFGLLITSSSIKPWRICSASHDDRWRLRWSTRRCNQRFQCRRAPCVSQPRCWSASD